MKIPGKYNLELLKKRFIKREIKKEDTFRGNLI